MISQIQSHAHIIIRWFNSIIIVLFFFCISDYRLPVSFLGAISAVLMILYPVSFLLISPLSLVYNTWLLYSGVFLLHLVHL